MTKPRQTAAKALIIWKRLRPEVVLDSNPKILRAEIDRLLALGYEAEDMIVVAGIGPGCPPGAAITALRQITEPSPEMEDQRMPLPFEEALAVIERTLSEDGNRRPSSPATPEAASMYAQAIRDNILRQGG